MTEASHKKSASANFHYSPLGAYRVKQSIPFPSPILPRHPVSSNSKTSPHRTSSVDCSRFTFEGAPSNPPSQWGFSSLPQKKQRQPKKIRRVPQLQLPGVYKQTLGAYSLKEIKEGATTEIGATSGVISPLNPAFQRSNETIGVSLPGWEVDRKKIGVSSSRERTKSQGKQIPGEKRRKESGREEQSRSFQSIQMARLESRYKKRSDFTKKYQNYFKENEARGKDAMQTTVSTVTPVGRANISIFTRDEHTHQQGSLESEIKPSREMSLHQKKLAQKYELRKIQKQTEQLEQLVRQINGQRKEKEALKQRILKIKEEEVRVRERELTQRENNAAVTIQRIFKGWFTRKIVAMVRYEAYMLEKQREEEEAKRAKEEASNRVQEYQELLESQLKDLDNAVSKAGFGVEADVLDRACRKIQHATRGFLNRLKWHLVFKKFRAFRKIGEAAVRLHTLKEGPFMFDTLKNAYKAQLKKEEQARRAQLRREAAKRAKANKHRQFGVAYRAGVNSKQSSFSPAPKSLDPVTRQASPVPSGKKNEGVAGTASSTIDIDGAKQQKQEEEQEQGPLDPQLVLHETESMKIIKKIHRRDGSSSRVNELDGEGSEYFSRKDNEEEKSSSPRTQEEQKMRRTITLNQRESQDGEVINEQEALLQQEDQEGTKIIKADSIVGRNSSPLAQDTSRQEPRPGSECPSIASPRSEQGKDPLKEGAQKVPEIVREEAPSPVVSSKVKKRQKSPEDPELTFRPKTLLFKMKKPYESVFKCQHLLPYCVQCKPTACQPSYTYGDKQNYIIQHVKSEEQSQTTPSKLQAGASGLPLQFEKRLNQDLHKREFRSFASKMWPKDGRLDTLLHPHQKRAIIEHFVTRFFDRDAIMRETHTSPMRSTFQSSNSRSPKRKSGYRGGSPSRVHLEQWRAWCSGEIELPQVEMVEHDFHRIVRQFKRHQLEKSQPPAKGGVGVLKGVKRRNSGVVSQHHSSIKKMVTKNIFQPRSMRELTSSKRKSHRSTARRLFSSGKSKSIQSSSVSNSQRGRDFNTIRADSLVSSGAQIQQTIKVPGIKQFTEQAPRTPSPKQSSSSKLDLMRKYNPEGRNLSDPALEFFQIPDNVKKAYTGKSDGMMNSFSLNSSQQDLEDVLDNRLQGQTLSKEQIAEINTYSSGNLLVQQAPGIGESSSSNTLIQPGYIVKSPSGLTSSGKLGFLLKSGEIEQIQEKIEEEAGHGRSTQQPDAQQPNSLRGKRYLQKRKKQLNNSAGFMTPVGSNANELLYSPTSKGSLLSLNTPSFESSFPQYANILKLFPRRSQQKFGSGGGRLQKLHKGSQGSQGSQAYVEDLDGTFKIHNSLFIKRIG